MHDQKLADIAALFNEAAAQSRANNDSVAESLYRIIVADLPRDPIAAYNLATTLLRQGKYEEGFRLYESRAYTGKLNIQKPEYKEDPMPLPRSAETDPWWQQTLSAEDISKWLSAVLRA